MRVCARFSAKLLNALGVHVTKTQSIWAGHLPACNAVCYRPPKPYQLAALSMRRVNACCAAVAPSNLKGLVTSVRCASEALGAAGSWQATAQFTETRAAILEHASGEPLESTAARFEARTSCLIFTRQCGCRAGIIAAKGL